MNIFIFIPGGVGLKEGPVVPYKDEELSDLEDEGDESVSAAEFLARWKEQEYVKEEEYL